MKMHCEMVVDNAPQREELIECLEIIGVHPKIKRDAVSVDYEGEENDETSMRLIDIAENYVRHSIRIICKKGVRIDET